MQLASLTASAKHSRDAVDHFRLGSLAAALTVGLRDGRIVRDPQLIDLMRTAEQALGRAAELDPRNPEFALALAQYYSEAPATGPTERYAARAYRLARALDDVERTSEAARLLGEVYWRRYDAVAYRRELSRLATIDTDALISTPEGARRFLTDHTIVYEPPRGTGDLRRAAEFFTDAVTTSPPNAQAYLGLYAVLLELGEYATVLTRTAEHSRALPNDAWALLVRGAALQRLMREREAGASFQQAFALMDSSARERLTSLARILPRSDSLQYEHVSRARREQTNRQFWREADLLSLTTGNELETEFYSRVVEAELRYSDRRFGQSGADSDRGTMWIRYGPPTIRASFPTEMVRTADLNDGTPSRGSALQGMLLEIWYWEPHNLHVVFQGAPGYGSARLFDAYRQVASDARAAAPVAWSNVPIATHPLDSIAVQLTRFRNEDSIDVLVTARLPLGVLAQDATTASPSIDVGLFMTGSGGRMLERDSSRTPFATESNDPVELRSWRTRLSPGTIDYRVEALELSSMRGARARGRLGLVRKRGLSTSDLLIARAVTPMPGRAAARWTDYLISPSVGEFEGSEPIALLWETYALASRDGATRYRVHLTIARTGGSGDETLAARVTSGIRSLLGRSSSGKDSLSFTFDRTASPRQAHVDHLSLDVQDLPSGKYTIRVTIEDLVAGASASADTREMIIRRSR